MVRVWRAGALCYSVGNLMSGQRGGRNGGGGRGRGRGQSRGRGGRGRAATAPPAPRRYTSTGIPPDPPRAKATAATASAGAVSSTDDRKAAPPPRPVLTPPTPITSKALTKAVTEAFAAVLPMAQWIPEPVQALIIQYTRRSSRKRKHTHCSRQPPDHGPHPRSCF
jgi:hypothetical protein